MSEQNLRPGFRVEPVVGQMHDRTGRPCATELRRCAAAPSDVFNPHWEDSARRLMMWAADVIDAAEAALRPNAGVNP